MPLVDRDDIVLVEDDPVMGQSLLERFALEGWRCCWLRSAAQAEADWPMMQRAQVIISDMRLPDGLGKHLFERHLRDGNKIPFILITAYASIEDAVAMTRAGLADYWRKPFDIEEAVASLHGMLDGDGESAGERSEGVLGRSEAMRKLERMLLRLADASANILITGESGSGKEEAVRFLHTHSARAGKPLVAINCSAIPSELLESELFGYAQGAFTGAVGQKAGLIEKAHGGLLFFDEIGDMPLLMQAKLLRVLQDRKITRLGSDRSIDVDFRLVCATHRDLKAMVREGGFREDLYYRINVVHLHVPALRERGSDVLWLAHRILARLQDGRMRVRGLLPEAEQALLAHDFPGNVRELVNRLERAVALAEQPLLSARDLFPERENATGRDRSYSLRERVQQAERRAILEAVAASGGCVGKAAELLGISRKCLWEKARKLDIPLH